MARTNASKPGTQQMAETHLSFFETKKKRIQLQFGPEYRKVFHGGFKRLIGRNRFDNACPVKQNRKTWWSNRVLAFYNYFSE